MKRALLRTLAAAAAISLPVAAIAAPVPCPSGLICASRPQTVADALRALGYKAMVKKDPDGDPRITSGAGGYDYDIAFYGCTKGADCTSLGFAITFEKDSANSAELANMWNKDRRFSAMAYDPADGSLSLTYDVSTVGGLNRENFADVVDWWETILGLANKFFAEHPAK